MQSYTKMVLFNSQSQKRLQYYADQNIFSNDVYKWFNRNKSKRDFKMLLSTELKICDEQLKKISVKLWNDWNKELHEMNENDKYIFAKLLFNDGVYYRGDISNERLSNNMISQIVRKLENYGYIELLTFNSNEKVLIINPKFISKIIKQNGTKK